MSCSRDHAPTACTRLERDGIARQEGLPCNLPYALYHRVRSRRMILRASRGWNLERPLCIERYFLTGLRSGFERVRFRYPGSWWRALPTRLTA